MPDETLQPCAYHVVRYQPNLIRDEWVNIGVLLFIPGPGPDKGPGRDSSGACASGGSRSPPTSRACGACTRRRTRNCCCACPPNSTGSLPDARWKRSAILEKFDETLSNAVQLSPRKGLLARDPDAELDRIFREQVEPLREARRGVVEIRTRSDVRAQAADYFRTEKILRLMQRGVRVEEFTVPGDPMRIDFSYRRNGTRGFVHAVALGRDPGQAKLLAFTADAIRERIEHSEFLAVTEREPARGNVRDQFVSGILAESEIRVVPLAELRKWAHDVAPVLRAEART